MLFAGALAGLGSCPGYLAGKIKASTGEATSPSSASSPCRCSSRPWSACLVWTKILAPLAGRVHRRSPRYVCVPAMTVFLVLKIALSVSQSRSARCYSEPVGLVVASFCYLQFFPPPSGMVLHFLPSASTSMHSCFQQRAE